MSRNESRVDKLEYVASRGASEQMARLGPHAAAIVDAVENILASKRGLPREDVRIDLGREELLHRFTPQEIVEIHDYLKGLLR